MFSKYFLNRYDIKAPSLFKVRQVGKTLVNRYCRMREMPLYFWCCVDNFSHTWLFLAIRLAFQDPGHQDCLRWAEGACVWGTIVSCRARISDHQCGFIFWKHFRVVLKVQYPFFIWMLQVSLADLQNENDAERSFRKFKLVCEEVQVRNEQRIKYFWLNDDNSVHLVMHVIQMICTSGWWRSACPVEVIITAAFLISVNPTGQELPDQLPRDGSDHGQVEVDGEEVADADRGKLRRQDHRWLYSEVYSRSEKYSRKFLKWCISICYSWLLHDDTHHQDLWLEPTLFSETFSNLCHFLNFFILQAFLHRIHQKARDVHKEDRLCTGWTGDQFGWFSQIYNIQTCASKLMS